MPVAPPDHISAHPARYDGAEKRRRLLEAALEAFASAGYEGAGVRRIAAAAGIEQGHLSYYFSSKMTLWRSVIEAFAPEPMRRLESQLPACADLDAVSAARVVLPDFLRSFAENPRLTRLMLHEFSVNSERSDWLAEHFAQPVWAVLRPLFERLRDEGRLAGSAPEIAYFAMIGAALVTFGNADLVRRFTSQDPLSANWVDQAIEHMVRPVVSLAGSSDPPDRARTGG